MDAGRAQLRVLQLSRRCPYGEDSPQLAPGRSHGPTVGRMNICALPAFIYECLPCALNSVVYYISPTGHLRGRSVQPRAAVQTSLSARFDLNWDFDWV